MIYLNKPFLLMGSFLGIAFLFFIVGWLFPVEGPFDEVYDNHNKKHVRGVATQRAQEKQKDWKEIYIITEDEIEQYFLIP